MRKTIRPFFGFSLLVIGVILFILPIPLGLPIILVGLTLLTPEFKAFRRLVNWIENLSPKYGRQLRYFRMRILRFMGYQGESF